MKAYKTYLIDKLNNLSLARKLLMMQILCVLLPMLVTDSVIIGIVVNSNRQSNLQEMKNTVSSVEYTLNTSIETAVSLLQNIYSNRYVNEFMEEEFTDPLDYYNKYIAFIKDSLYPITLSSQKYNVMIYAENSGIVNGGYFQQLGDIVNRFWYSELQESNQDYAIYSEYVNTINVSQRQISLVRKMDFYHRGQSGNIIRLVMDYSGMSQSIISANYSNLVYVCEGDKILFSNDKKGGMQVPFQTMSKQLKDKAKVQGDIHFYGKKWDIYVLPQEKAYIQDIRQYFPLIAFMVLVNLLLPFIIMKLINQSFTQRIMEMDAVMENVDAAQLKQLSEIRGNDEISVLMKSYNRMAERMNELIQTVYKDNLRRHEIDLARQRAELLALHSQINPHFLFNALESIRMHSVIKKELETADMVEKLALMQRQSVEWGNDFVSLIDEIHFAEAYLELQKYRFGEKLSYKININEECNLFRIPKLTIVTFVENACVHGIEGKTSAGWIFVRAFLQEEQLVLEVEDTGRGMTPEMCDKLRNNMNSVQMEMLNQKDSVGVLNAALRLRLATKGKVRFELESEMDAGTIVTIKIPLTECMK